MAEDEKRAQQIMLDKAGAEAARLSRKLAETEAALNAAQGRLRHLEANFAELSIERTRLAAALDEANERNEHERANQRTRFEALQARAAASEKLLGEAREHLLARAEEIRDYDRRLRAIGSNATACRRGCPISKRTASSRESEFNRDRAGQGHADRPHRGAGARLHHQGSRARTRRADGGRAQRTAGSDGSGAAADRLTAEQAIEELNTALQREQLERAVADGALETARKDFARVAREVMSLQRNQASLEAHAQPRAANAA